MTDGEDVRQVGPVCRQMVVESFYAVTAGQVEFGVSKSSKIDCYILRKRFMAMRNHTPHAQCIA